MSDPLVTLGVFGPIFIGLCIFAYRHPMGYARIAWNLKMAVLFVMIHQVARIGGVIDAQGVIIELMPKGGYPTQLSAELKKLYAGPWELGLTFLLLILLFVVDLFPILKKRRAAEAA